MCTLNIPSVAAVSSELCSLRVGIIMKPLRSQNYFLPVFDVLYFFSSDSFMIIRWLTVLFVVVNLSCSCSVIGLKVVRIS